MKNIKNYVIALLVVGICGFGYAQSGLISSALFLIASTGSLVQYSGYQQGQPIFGPAVGQAVLKGTLTTTAATSNSTTITGITSTSRCSFEATNATSGNPATVPQPYYTVAANTFTLNYSTTATAGGTFAILCTPN